MTLKPALLPDRVPPLLEKSTELARAGRLRASSKVQSVKQGFMLEPPEWGVC